MGTWALSGKGRMAMPKWIAGRWAKGSQAFAHLYTSHRGKGPDLDPSPPMYLTLHAPDFMVHASLPPSLSLSSPPLPDSQCIVIFIGHQSFVHNIIQPCGSVTSPSNMSIIFFHGVFEQSGKIHLLSMRSIYTWEFGWSCTYSWHTLQESMLLIPVLFPGIYCS